ncbi:MAG: signal transduction histidine kinase [Flavobacterium sp.]|jgi:signal transduction histidine kinase
MWVGTSTNIQAQKNFLKELELVDLKSIIEDVKEYLSEEIANKKVKIEVIEVNIIIFQFRQLVYNLVSNSIKFSSEANQPHVTISCKITSGKDFKHDKLKPEIHYCNIKVTDNGIDFDQQYGERIFEVFQRLQRRDKYLGTGIGPAIVKKR